ncbi:SRPBCC family protein [Pseudooctadecabacter jejudonensis]|uniref:Polyketide cyclase / dehydrase and lipid transport n=1 Tax=Pseudooctadecabacter jejudonensis TaxID=1391910 RepID=A0A1Y5T326_9RHOB|nr:SRPBCC family protein [Pseudooctadecabacter jejudonensis]SLN54767.1 hypothetical protein PSJ8397_02869 [Pseudooctadecabacter jejudonensis]
MDIQAREDIEAPIEFVYDQLTDFASFERSVMRRGADVQRLADGAANGLGAKWRVKFMMRGVERKIAAEVTKAEKPNLIGVSVTSKNVDAEIQLELVPLSPARTRLNVSFDAVAKTIPAKLFFQSLRFARQKTNNRFKGAVGNFAEDIEKRYRA